MEKAYICSPLFGNEKENINNAIAYATVASNKRGKVAITIIVYSINIIFFMSLCIG